MPTEYIGDIPIPDPGASGQFPLTTVYPWSVTQEPEVVIHLIGNTTANLKVEQRYYLGPRAKKFFCRCQMNETDRDRLADFWDNRKGSWQAFDYAAPNEDGSHTHYTVRFAEEPLSLEHLAAAVATCGVWLVEVPDPAAAPEYEYASTVTRFPDSTLAAALLSQTQEVIPLIDIQVRESGYDAIHLSDRRVTTDDGLYQPRLIDWSGISQSLGGSTDQAQFTFGNADRVMAALANDTNLMRASIQFSLLHVGTLIVCRLWKGEITDWQSDEGPEFRVTASDGLYELNLPYPIRKVDRRCWKSAGDGINCFAASTSCLKVFKKTTGETGNDCTDLGQTLRYGGVVVKPQSVKIRENAGKTQVTATSLVSDSVYGQVLPDIYTDREMLVNCQVVAGRDESDFYGAMGIVGRGPIGSYGTPRYTSTDDGGIGFTGHRLDGQPHHGFGTATPSDGLRTSLGPALCDATADNFSMFREGAEYASGTAWVEIRRTDAVGIQPSKTSEHAMLALVETGLKGYTWSNPSTRSALSVLSNPVWIAVNVALNALGLSDGTAAQQVAVFDVAAAIAAAAVCDQSVHRLIPADDVHETQFAFCGTLAEQKPLRDWLQEILNNCCGYFVNSCGLLKIGIRSNSSVVSSGTFTEGNILAGSLTLRPIRPAFNWLTAQFGDADYDWKANTVSLYDETHGTLIGGVVPVYNQAQINLVGTCTKSQAARIITSRIREELGGTTAAEWMAARQIAFRTTVLALGVEAGMVCSLTHDDMPGGAGEFRVTGWRLNKDYSIDIEGRTTTDSMYDLTTGDKPADAIPEGPSGELIIEPLPGDVEIVSITQADDGLSTVFSLEYEPPGTGSEDIGSFVGVDIQIEAPDGSGSVRPAGGHDYDGFGALVSAVNTSGTAVEWVSGNKFGLWGDFWTSNPRHVLIGSTRYPVAAYVDEEHLTLGSSAGTQTGVALTGRTGTLQISVAMPVPGDTWRFYACAKSRTCTRRLTLHTATAGDYETPSITIVPAGTPSSSLDSSDVTFDGDPVTY